MQQGMRFLDLGCGSGAAADYFASRCNVEIMCVTNSTVQADLCRWKSRKCNGRVQSPSFRLRPPRTSGGAFRRDLRVRVDRLHKRPGRLVGALLAIAQVWRTTAYIIRSPGSLDACRREHDYRSVTAFFENWRYNFFGANLLVFKLRRLGFDPIRYRQLPFWARGLTFNFIQHLLLWKFRLRMRTMVDLERIIWRTSKVFVFGNGYNIVLASKP